MAALCGPQLKRSNIILFPDALDNSGRLKPQYNKVPRDWENVLVIREVVYPVYVTNLWETTKNFVI